MNHIISDIKNVYFPDKEGHVPHHHVMAKVLKDPTPVYELLESLGIISMDMTPDGGINYGHQPSASVSSQQRSETMQKIKKTLFFELGEYAATHPDDQHNIQLFIDRYKDFREYKKVINLLTLIDDFVLIWSSDDFISNFFSLHYEKFKNGGTLAAVSQDLYQSCSKFPKLFSSLDPQTMSLNHEKVQRFFGPYERSTQKDDDSIESYRKFFKCAKYALQAVEESDDETNRQIAVYQLVSLLQSGDAGVQGTVLLMFALQHCPTIQELVRQKIEL